MSEFGGIGDAQWLKRVGWICFFVKFSSGKDKGRSGDVDVRPVPVNWWSEQQKLWK
jgi:hypothetical protein